jgi:hypothetical protein
MTTGPLNALLGKTDQRKQVEKDVPMFHKLLILTAAVALGTVGVLPTCVGQMPGMQMPAGTQTDQSHQTTDAEMMAHQSEMQGLLTRLNASFKAVADGRDTTGYLPDKSILKAHEADISALRTAVRDHKLFVDSYEEQCGVNSKQHDSMVQHQQVMKGILYDVVDTWEGYLKADASGAQVSDTVGLTFSEHQGALERLSAAIAQHQTAMAQMKKGCS